GRLDPRRPADQRTLICAGFCSFYRPEKDEAEKCGGFAWLSSLWETHRQRPRGTAAPLHVEIAADVDDIGDEIKAASLKPGPVCYRFDAELAELICAACPFLSEGGCDYRNPAISEKKRLQPCGGYIVVAHLLDQGLVRVQRKGR
ncbi:MAG: hypothetical protein H5T84_00030, partial [Thermoleophilia bacterium]|nr:hypothetical protein [Thermoleophilia bacterium]